MNSIKLCRKKSLFHFWVLSLYARREKRILPSLLSSPLDFIKTNSLGPKDKSKKKIFYHSSVKNTHYVE